MKTRQEAIATQKNAVIKARLKKMTDAEWAAHQAKMEQSIKSGAVARSVSRMAADLLKK